ncbi:hypothetical protein N9I15_03715 [Flavobacteriaceae bacterium]|jgi:hypothetical protein|nr:hypothetical protein [Flavobacteriaceae bacterium]MDA9588127.1 hypothetical protein [Flavobacteriaceae bacterium]
MSKNLKYYQQILQKVSFDSHLFSKELKKAYAFLTPKDRDLLRSWVADYVEHRSDLQSVVFSL